MGHHQLDTLDEQILQLIADNARIPFLEVARACNVSGAAIHQRIQKLTNLGILKGSEYVIDPEKIGYETCAYIGIYLKDPATFDAVTKALEAIPEIVECHFTTGKYDMFIKLYHLPAHKSLPIILQIKPFASIISLTAMHPGKLSVWTGYPLSPPGQEESIIWRNSRCKATGRLLCAMQPAERLFILPLSPHSSRNGWKRTKTCARVDDTAIKQSKNKICFFMSIII